MCLLVGRTDKVYLFFTLSDHLMKKQKAMSRLKGRRSRKASWANMLTCLLAAKNLPRANRKKSTLKMVECLMKKKDKNDLCA